MYISDTSLQKLVHDENYYRSIFKKTEKIVAVVFYILNHTDTDKRTETHIGNIAGKAHLVHEHALRTLEVRAGNAREVLEQFAQSLIALDSTFRVASTTGLFNPEVTSVVVTEIDLVLRGLKTYLGNDAIPSTDVPLQRKVRSNTPRQSISTSTNQTHNSPKEEQSTVDRRERIKTIIEAKGQATVKDIAEIITDCSTKTIQRELNAMIDGHVLKRQGERRWSKYSLI